MTLSFTDELHLYSSTFVKLLVGDLFIKILKGSSLKTSVTYDSSLNSVVHPTALCQSDYFE